MSPQENWNDDNFNTNDPSGQFQGGDVRVAPSGFDDQRFGGNTTDNSTPGAGGNFTNTTGGAGAGTGGGFDEYGSGRAGVGAGTGASGQDWDSSGRQGGNWDSGRSGAGGQGGRRNDTPADTGSYGGNTTDYDTYGAGTGGGAGGASGKASMGDRVKGIISMCELRLDANYSSSSIGTMEKVAGKITGNQNMAERGQERKVSLSV